MAITNGYASLTAFKARVGISAGGAHDDDAERAIEAASRAADRWCGRRFYADTAATARYYTALLEQVTHLPVDDISTTVGLLVATDDNWDGVYENAWTLNARTGSYGFMVEPTNAAVAGRPYTRLHAVVGSWPTVEQGVSVTAKWGWPAIPKEVEEATLIIAARYYKRKDTPYGMMGTEETGFVTLPRMDPDAQALLAPYRRLDWWGD